jgi:hypothetical protein
MPHVDDGVLHAYLDGALGALADAGVLQDGASAADVEAHLRDCGDCRARLESERTVRAQAGSVLHDARPAFIDIPPFERIAPAAPRRRRSTLQYAWAASVLLALGAGWMGGSLLRSSTDTSRQASRMESLDVAPMSAAAAPRQDELAAVAPQVETVAAEPHAEVATAASSTARAGIATVADSPAMSVAGQAAEPLGRPVPAADAEMSRAADPAVTAVEQRLERMAAAAPVPPAVPSAMALQSRAMQALVATETAAAALGGTEQVAAVAQFSAHVQRARADELAWLPLSADDQQRREAAVLVVRGAGTPQIDAAIASPGTMLRVRQRLISGEEVQLLLWSPPAVTADVVVTPGTPLRAAPPRRPGEAAAAGREAARGRTPPLELQEVRLADGVHELILHDSVTGTYVSLSGALSPAQLRQLVERLIEPN